MTQAVGTGGTATYAYNGDGLKVQRIGPDGTTRYYHDGFRPIWETDGAGVMTAQLDRDIFGNLLSRAEPGSRRYYHTDGLGSTVALTDEAGATAASMLYDAWGNSRATSGTGQGKYRFTGAELDSASGLYHMAARFYDPSIGRWLSEDPVQDKFFEPFTLNFYAYVSNNPALLLDPDGRDVDIGTLAMGLAGASLAIPGLEWAALGALALFVGDAMLMGSFERKVNGLVDAVDNALEHVVPENELADVRAHGRDARHYNEVVETQGRLKDLIKEIEKALREVRSKDQKAKLELAREKAKKALEQVNDALKNMPQ